MLSEVSPTSKLNKKQMFLKIKLLGYYCGPLKGGTQSRGERIYPPQATIMKQFFIDVGAYGDLSFLFNTWKNWINSSCNWFITTILVSNEIDIMNDPLEETITNVKSINSEIETTNNNNFLEETEVFLIEWILSIYSYNIF